MHTWKQAPFLRLFIPLAAGITLQYYGQLPARFAIAVAMAGITGMIFFNYRLSFLQYRLSWLNGIFIHALLLSLGALLSWQKQATSQSTNIINRYHTADYITAALDDAPSEKNKSYRATATVTHILHKDSMESAEGTIVLYFKKDTSLQQLQYGSIITFNKPLQRISNSGNPGAFDYKQYAAFNGMFYQVYLQPGDFIVSGKTTTPFKKMLVNIRKEVLRIISRYVPGTKEQGLAAALLIGYKDALDKTLVQSYSNTGVVHVIAISGLHLGLIYWLLNVLFGLLTKTKKLQWLKPVFIIAGLWLFALLAGGGPSVLRSAVMFTCIVIGECLSKKAVIYNTLAASAFILLCINPFWLWDAGFQLSYAAVLSIVLFMKPVYNLLYVRNKLLDALWKLNAVTLAAQVLTIPITIYYFHQFPVYFLLTNVVAVPLSTVIVFGEIVLCAVGTLPWLAHTTGNVLHRLIVLMNRFIEHMEQLPFALWQHLQINLLQLVVLYGFIVAISYWLFEKSKPAFITALGCLLVFVVANSYSLTTTGRQQQLVVYNIPQHRAIDFISGNNCFFDGDEGLENFYLNSARNVYRAMPANSLPSLQQYGNCFLFNHKSVVVIDNHTRLHDMAEKVRADVVIITQNPRLYLTDLAKTIDCSQLVIDGTNPLWKVNKWKAEAVKLRLSCFSVVDNGAFVMKLR